MTLLTNRSGSRLPRKGRFIAAAALLAATTVLVAHDSPHHNPEVEPYEGPGWDGTQGGQVPVDFPSENVHLLSWLSLSDFGAHSTGNDCWGYVSPSGREYAIMGLSGGTAFVEITVPSQPEIVAVIAGPTSLWRDMKTYQHYCYAVSEGGQGIQVIDLAQIDDGIVTHIGNVTFGGSTSTHNVAIDEVSGYLYRCGGGSGLVGIRVYSLLNPASPTFVGEWHTRYVHDAQIVRWTEGPYSGRQIAFLASNTGSGGGGTPSLTIVDVTDKSDMEEIGFTTYSAGGFSHQCWLTEARDHILLNDELESAPTTTTRVINVEDLTDPFEETVFTNGNTAIGHNIYTRGDLSFHANYRSGLRVFDISDPLDAQEIGYFDTWVEDDDDDFNGLWSNYPYFPSGVVIGSDLDKGMFVWWVGDLPITFEYPNGRPEHLSPAGGDSLLVRINTAAGVELEDAALFVDAGGGAVEVELTPLGRDLYEATFPAFPCGQTVSYHLSASTTGGFGLNDPSTAPAIGFTALSAYGVEVAFEDDFSGDLGWSVGAPDDDATAGIWVREDPIGTSSGGQQVQPDAPFTGSACYFTGQHPGGGAGASDVDNGATTLFSPVFDLSKAGEALISYRRWYSNGAGAGPNNDVFVVSISNDGGGSWQTVETVGPSGPGTSGGWHLHEFTVSDVVEHSDQMRMRFVASDTNPQSLIEAAIDAFQISIVDCESVDQCVGDFNTDQTVDVADLLQLLSAWGSCDGCAHDLNLDGEVDVQDLLLLLAAWGPCAQG